MQHEISDLTQPLFLKPAARIHHILYRASNIGPDYSIQLKINRKMDENITWKQISWIKDVCRSGSSSRLDTNGFGTDRWWWNGRTEAMAWLAVEMNVATFWTRLENEPAGEIRDDWKWRLIGTKRRGMMRIRWFFCDGGWRREKMEAE